MSKDRTNIPKADTLMGSMRSMGYSFEAAVADIIDNSISAHCTFVKLLFPMNPIERIAFGILDDGCGMSADELFEAMRYGSAAVEQERDVDDLGRFGLGLKAASLSQCKILTVASIKQNIQSAFSWDYNYILQKRDWIVKELNDKEFLTLPYIEQLKGLQNGTLVIWEDFDVLEKSNDGQAYSALSEKKNIVEDALSLIFHRYMSASAKPHITIYINNLRVKPQDPFLESHSKTTTKKEKTIALPDSTGIEQQIKVKPYILPYATDLTEKDRKLIGGIENLRSKQGFYVYRNHRLIIWGTWFGLKNAELTKNARVRVDIPNSLDDIWSIDIKKQTATIPRRIQNQLKRTVIEAMDLSVNKQRHRGRKEKVDDDTDYIWDRMSGRNNTFYYQINRDSKLFQMVKDKLSDEDYNLFEMLVHEIEENLPLQQIYIDRSNDAIKPLENDNREDEVFQLAVTMIAQIKKLSIESASEIINNIMKSEPFCNFSNIREKILNVYKE